MHAISSICQLFTFFVSLVLCCVIGCRAQCTVTEPWVPILPETAYDRNASSVADTAGRPLGFKLSVIEYQDNENPISPCLQVTGAADRRIEIMAESDPPGSIICLRDQANANPICMTQIYECRQAIADAVNFEFFCDADSCDESSVTFWYRFVVSEDPEILDPELWCDSRDTGEYPSSLNNVLPPDRDLEPADPNVSFGAATTTSGSILAVALALIVGIVMQISSAMH